MKKINRMKATSAMEALGISGNDLFFLAIVLVLKPEHREGIILPCEPGFI
jgi:hypothetical protein